MKTKTYYRIQNPDGTWQDDSDDGSPSWIQPSLKAARMAKEEIEAFYDIEGLEIVKVNEEKVE